MWRFQLQDGVRFSDDKRFDAAAVCANFERWYHFTGILQSPSVSVSWQTVFGGFATPDLALSYPTGVTDPIWVDTAAIAGAFKTDLEPSGSG